MASSKEKQETTRKISSNINTGMQAGDTDANPESSYDDYELWSANLNKKEGAVLASEQTIKYVKLKISDELLKKRLAEIEEEYTTKEEKEAAAKRLKENWYKTELEIAKKMEDNQYKYSDIKTKARLVKERRETAQTIAEKARQEMALLDTKYAHENHTNAEMKKARQDRDAANKAVINNIKQEMVLRKATKAHTTAERQEKNRMINELRMEEYNAHQQQLADYDNDIQKLKEKEKAAKKAAKAGGDENAASTFEKERKEIQKQKREAKKEMNKADFANFGSALASNIGTELKNSVGKAIGELVDAVNGGVDDAIKSVGQYKSRIDARLQGTESNYTDIASTLKKSLAVSPYVKQTAVLQKLNEAVDKGIAYNVEQRAFLQTVTDSIVATFNAFDSNLMRLIRLQQADMTAAKMGVEAQLLEFFNQTFSDNSYLESTYDTVSQSLIEASSQMTRDMSLSFEYTVQKWMGSLSSLGFSADTIQKIATGVNYLGSGNVQALVGDTELMNLMAMSAYRAGYSISDLLVKGVNDSNINDLLKSMVEYLAEIADDKNNAVVKAAYGDVFNFSQSDLRAITNLTTDDITNIHNQAMSFTQASEIAQAQLNALPGRLSMTEKINNVWENFLYSSGETIGNSVVGAITWKMLTLIDKVTGGQLKLPEIMVYGFGVNIPTSIPNLMKAGIFGLSAIGQIGNVVSSIMGGGGLDLGVWDYSEYTSRGGKFQSNLPGATKTLSGSKTAKSSAASSDNEKAAIEDTAEDQEESKKRSEELSEDEVTLEVLYKEIFEKKSIMYVSDTPVLSLMTPIAMSVASVDKSVQSMASKINNQEKSIKVHVTNLSDIAIPKSIAVENLLGCVSADDLAKKLTPTSSSNSGFGSSGEDDEVSMEALVKKLLELLDGDLEINVSDGDVHSKLDTITTKLNNL